MNPFPGLTLDLTYPLKLYHNLRESDYNVILNAGQYHNRFEITFSTSDDTLGVDDPTQNGIDIFYAYQMEKLILINPNLLDIKSIEFFSRIIRYVWTNTSKGGFHIFELNNYSLPFTRRAEFGFVCVTIVLIIF